MLEIYRDSDYLFLHLNDYEAFEKVLPSKIFEYAATHKHIIAGVAGYAREFLEENLPDAIVFDPCNVDDFKDKFFRKKSEMFDRSEFIKKYTRKTIMMEMAKKVYNL